MPLRLLKDGTVVPCPSADEVHPQPPVGPAQVLKDVTPVDLDRRADPRQRVGQAGLPIVAGQQRPEVHPGRASAGPRLLGHCHTDTASAQQDCA
jgi:hypothetical protein